MYKQNQRMYGAWPRWSMPIFLTSTILAIPDYSLTKKKVDQLQVQGCWKFVNAVENLSTVLEVRQRLFRLESLTNFQHPCNILGQNFRTNQGTTPVFFHGNHKPLTHSVFRVILYTGECLIFQRQSRSKIVGKLGKPWEN